MSLRSYSKKRRQRETSASEFRRTLVAIETGCWICGSSPLHPHRGRPKDCSTLDCHEIANGVNRQKALDKPFAILILCRFCNGHIVTDKSAWPEARQLSLLRTKRPERFDLAAYNRLVNERAPNRITLAEVDLFACHSNSSSER